MAKAIEFNNVWKKYKRGEKFNSLRDTIPYVIKCFTQQTLNDNILGEQEFWAVKDVSFSVERGEVIGLIGPNGAGKSTILKLLSGIIVPTKGNLAVKGRLSALIEVTAGFHSDLTGRENVYLNGTILGMKKKEIDARLDAIIEFSGVKDFIDTPVKRYSSGMMSRLGFSVAAHIDPDVLLVDEVLAVGDITFQSKCAQKMRELLHSGVTIILVSHNLALVQSLCKRVILIDHGEVNKEGTSQDVIPHYENLVFKHMEDGIKYQIHVDGQKVNTGENSLVEIPHVTFHGKQGQAKDGFSIQEQITLTFDYKANEKIDDPVFSLDIIRADGIVCCSSNSLDAGLTLKAINGKGLVDIDLSQMKLAPGIYVARIAIWDKLMIHPYVIRKQDILRIEVGGQNKHTEAVFIADVNWQHKELSSLKDGGV